MPPPTRGTHSSVVARRRHPSTTTPATMPIGRGGEWSTTAAATAPGLPDNNNNNTFGDDGIVLPQPSSSKSIHNDDKKRTGKHRHKQQKQKQKDRLSGSSSNTSSSTTTTSSSSSNNCCSLYNGVAPPRWMVLAAMASLLLLFILLVFGTAWILFQYYFSLYSSHGSNNSPEWPTRLTHRDYDGWWKPVAASSTSSTTVNSNHSGVAPLLLDSPFNHNNNNTNLRPPPPPRLRRSKSHTATTTMRLHEEEEDSNHNIGGNNNSTLPQQQLALKHQQRDWIHSPPEPDALNESLASIIQPTFPTSSSSSTSSSNNNAILNPIAAATTTIPRPSTTTALRRYSRQLAWLMSFPNSGTSYTSQLVRDLTRTWTATNYGDESGAARQRVDSDSRLSSSRMMREETDYFWDDEDEGPFWIQPNAASPHDSYYTAPPLSAFVLTKTHCGIRCVQCPPEAYAESTYSFRHQCLATRWKTPTRTIATPTSTVQEDENDDTDAKPQSQPPMGRTRIQTGTYPIHNVRKAVHLVRNPFDNVVSRFHLTQKQKGSRRPTLNRTKQQQQPNHHELPQPIPHQQLYPLTRQGFLDYCLGIDFLFTNNEIQYAHFHDPETTSSDPNSGSSTSKCQSHVMTDLWMVPCHADFLRYVEWHNLAFVTTRDYQMETLVIHYDWYNPVDNPRRWNQTVTGLLQFLNLPGIHPSKDSDLPPFDMDNVYDDYFTRSEKLIVRRAFEFMASPQTWEHVKEYFPSDEDSPTESG